MRTKYNYYVYGDLTAFHGCDMWGRKHTRLIGVACSLFTAKFIAYDHIRKHPHGSAFISETRWTAKQLGWGSK